MLKKFSKILLHDNMLCMLFVFGVLWGLSKIPLNTDIINPISQALNDVEMNDIAFSNLGDDPTADTNVVVVNLGNLDRAGVAELLRKINKCEPAVIGIDAFFRAKKNPAADSLLAQAFSEIKNLVLVTKIDRPDEKGEFDTLETSNPIFLKKANLAYANMITKEKEFRTSRTFSPVNICKGKDQVFFGCKVASFYDKEKVEKFLKRKNAVEVINYRGNVYSGEMYNKNMNAFTALDVEDVMTDNFVPEVIKNKIVLVGYLGETLYNVKFWDEDKFYTPLNKIYIGKSFPDMFGVVVHANIISMILHEDYVDEFNAEIGLIINLLLCFMNVVIFSFFYKKFPLFYDGFSNLVQLVECVVLLGVEIYVFSKNRIIIDLNLAIFFLLLLGNFLDLYYGLLKSGYSVLIEKLKLNRERKSLT